MGRKKTTEKLSLVFPIVSSPLKIYRFLRNGRIVADFQLVFQRRITSSLEVLQLLGHPV